MRIIDRNRKAFTLIELIVVIVILGILAAIAIPTFSQVIENSKLKTAESTVGALARETLALAALDAKDGVTLENVQAAFNDLQPTSSAASAGVYAAEDYTLVVAPEVSDSSTAISVSIVDGTLGLALNVPGAGCSYAHGSGASVSSWSAKGSVLNDCSGEVSVKGKPSKDNPGNPDPTETPTEEPTEEPTPEPTEPEIVAPSAPTEVNVSYSGLTGTVAWAAQDGAEQYVVYVNGIEHATVESNTLSVNFPISNGETYSVKVVSVNSAGASESGETSITLTPSIPSNFILEDENTLTWTPAYGASGYILERDGVEVELEALTSYEISDVNAGTTETYRIAAFNAAGRSAWASIDVTFKPDAVTSLIGNYDGTKVTLTWDKSYGATSYEVWSTSSGAGSPERRITTLGDLNTYSIKNSSLPYLSSYEDYEIRAKNSGGTTPGTVVRVDIKPIAPTATWNRLHAGAARLDWSMIPGSGTLEVRTRANNGTWSGWTTPTTDATTGLGSLTLNNSNNSYFEAELRVKRTGTPNVSNTVYKDIQLW